MKRKLYLFTAVLFFVQITFAQNTLSKFQHRRSGNPDQNTLGNGETPNSMGQSGTGGNIDVVYHRIWWRINPDSSKAIKGTVTTYFKTLQANVAAVTFDLRQSSFNNVSLIATYHGTVCARTVSAANILTITLPSTIVATGTLDSVVVSYYGIPPAVSGAAQGYQVATDATSGQKVIYTLSESYEDRDWWPCKADMQDKIDSMDIIVNVPWASPTAADTFWVATNGKLVDSTISGGSRTFTFKNRYPMASYLVCVSVARYNRYYRSININGTNTQVVYNLIRGKSAANYTAITNAMDIVNQVVVAFSNKFGDYPYKNEKHGFYDGLAGAGGMEHQTFSAIDGGTVAGSTGALADQATLCHELTHQWFGDKATCATWTDLWLNEGFARYGEALAGELVPATGLNPVAERGASKAAAQGVTTVPLRIPSYTTSNQVWNTAGYVSTVYDRGCMVVSMLRALSGDNNFFLSCKNYLDSLTSCGYKGATSDSLKLNFNRVLNYDLTPFFNDWVYGKGHPTANINWNNPLPKRLAVSMGTQTRTAGATATYFHNVIVLRVQGAIPATQDTTIVIYDIDGNNLAKAGMSTGIGTAYPGNYLQWDLSFVPTTVTFDAFKQTLSAGGTITKLGTLAIQVQDFTAHKTAAGNEALLSLITTDPITKVELQKSANGTDFVTAGEMNLLNPGNQTLNYNLIDPNPFAYATFYRAKIFYAGKEEFTNIVKIQSVQVKGITVSPNPVNSTLKLNFNNQVQEETTIKILGVDGKKVTEIKTKNDFIHIDVSSYSAGIYMVQVVRQGEVVETSKFLVRH